MCNDPVNSCSGVTLRGDTDERSNGRRDQTLDSATEVGAGAGNYPEQGHAIGGESSVRPAAVGDGELGGGWQALRAKSEDVREQYERQLKDLQEAYGEAMLELRVRKKLASLLGKDET